MVKRKKQRKGLTPTRETNLNNWIGGISMYSVNDGQFSDLYKSIPYRISTRNYSGTASEEKIKALKMFAANISDNEVRIEIYNSGEVYTGMGKAIKGTDCFASIAGKRGAKFQEGYLGEVLALECTRLGLGTCWIGGTMKRSSAKKIASIKGKEGLHCIIAIGESEQLDEALRENRPFENRKRKQLNKLFSYPSRESRQPVSIDDLADWQKNAVLAVDKAPSAMNMQPYTLEVGDTSIKIIRAVGIFPFQMIDIGIAKLHLELGAFSSGTAGRWEKTDDNWVFTTEK